MPVVVVLGFELSSKPKLQQQSCKKTVLILGTQIFSWLSKSQLAQNAWPAHLLKPTPLLFLSPSPPTSSPRSKLHHFPPYTKPDLKEKQSRVAGRDVSPPAPSGRAHSAALLVRERFSIRSRPRDCIPVSADQTGPYGSQRVSVAMHENICIWICLLLYLSTPVKVNVFPWSRKDVVQLYSSMKAERRKASRSFGKWWILQDPGTINLLKWNCFFFCPRDTSVIPISADPSKQLGESRVLLSKERVSKAPRNVSVHLFKQSWQRESKSLIEPYGERKEMNYNNSLFFLLLAPQFNFWLLDSAEV